MEGRSSSIVDSTYRPSLMALTELCEIKVGTNSRPICQLLIEMVSFNLKIEPKNFQVFGFWKQYRIGPENKKSPGQKNS